MYLFQGLLLEVDDDDREKSTRTRLPLQTLASFVLKHSSLPFILQQSSTDDQVAEIEMRIAEEFGIVQAYLTVWRSTGGVNKEAPKQVDDKLHQELEEIVYPWLEIKADPAPERSDGRFAKAFPLTFPTGSGDLYHARLRSDFSTADWAQHVFRYYDGRALSYLRGHRVVWAIFNTFLCEAAHTKGSLLQKHSHVSVLLRKTF